MTIMTVLIKYTNLIALCVCSTNIWQQQQCKKNDKHYIDHDSFNKVHNVKVYVHILRLIPVPYISFQDHMRAEL